MHRKLNITLAVVLIIISITACNREKVKYISSTADDIEEATIEEVCWSEGVATELDSELYELEQPELVPVHVCGAVNNPGLYYLESECLKADALDMAGGFAPDAAVDYINLAEMVTYGEKIYFPYAYELEDGYNLNQGMQDQTTNNLVNINTATKDELMTLPGIGESKADAIIKYREKNGPFQSIEDITKIPGIKEGVYNNIKEHIVVN